MSLVVLEGNIGAGKSTVLVELEKMGYRVEQEAVVDSDSMFSRALRSNSTFHLQVAASIDTYVRLERTISTPGDVRCFMERGRHGLETFLQVAKENNMVSPLEYDLCCALKTTTEKATQHHSNSEMVIFLEVEPSLCFQRVKSRNRIGEENITLDYLRRIDHWYRTVLFDTANVNVVAKVTVQKEWSAHDVATAIVDTIAANHAKATASK